jgi:hypothetical protein
MLCKEPKCKNNANYNYEKTDEKGNYIGYCIKHKKPGMIYMHNNCQIL